EQRQTFLIERARARIVSLGVRQHPHPVEYFRACRCPFSRPRQGQQSRQPATSLGYVAAYIPEPPQRPPKSKAPLRIAALLRPRQRRPQVVVLPFQPLQPVAPLSVGGLLRQARVIGRMPPAQGDRFFVAELFVGEFTQGVQHPEARLA